MFRVPPNIVPAVRAPFRRACLAALGLLAGCGTLTESPTQQVTVQTVLDHQEVAGVGCLLYNDVGRWFVTTPARVTIRKSTEQLRVDCRKDGAIWGFEKIASKENSTLWGNVAFTAGAGYLVDRNTGQGWDYPAVLTVLMQRLPQATPHAAPPEGRTVY